MTETILGFDTLQNRLHFTGALVARTGLRIGAGRDTDVAGHDLPVMRDASGRPFIPGASFKGVLRAYVEALLRGLAADAEYQRTMLACYVLESKSRCIRDEEIKQWRKTLDPADIAERVLENSCMACQTFGSPWLASHVAVRDLAVAPALWFGQFEVRQGVSIDRDTETAANQLLYSFETVPPGTRFALTIAADNLLDWQKGLLLLGLQPFIHDSISLGGARSRGLGRVELLDGAWHGWDRGAGAVASIMALFNAPSQSIADGAQQQWQDALNEKLKGVARV